MLHPAVVASVALLVVNDQLLKRWYPGAVTGKLSDVAGIAFLPILIVSLLEVMRRACGARRTRATTTEAATAIVATVVVFAAVKTWGPAGELFRIVDGWLQWPFAALADLARGRSIPGVHRVDLVADPTDLVALCAIIVPLGILRSDRTGRRAERGTTWTTTSLVVRS